MDDVRNYAHGIARLVLLERRRQPAVWSLDEHPHLAGVTAATPDDDDDRLQRCFNRCLADIPEDGRSLVIAYYEGEGGAKISNRRRLAATLGLSENALRSRVQRLRDRLEHCIEVCVSRMK